MLRIMFHHPGFPYPADVKKFLVRIKAELKPSAAALAEQRGKHIPVAAFFAAEFLDAKPVAFLNIENKPVFKRKNFPVAVTPFR